MILCFDQDWMGGVVGFRHERIVAILMARPNESGPSRTTIVVKNGDTLQPAQVSADIDEAVQRWDECLDDGVTILGFTDPEGDKVFILADEISQVDVGGDGAKTATQIRLDCAKQGILVRESGKAVIEAWARSTGIEESMPEPKPKLWTPPPDLAATLARAKIDGGAR